MASDPSASVIAPTLIEAKPADRGTTAWNAAFNPDFLPDAGWTPVLYGKNGAADKAHDVRDFVSAGAGPSEHRAR